MEFLLVAFPESRRVLVDGDDEGETNKILPLRANEYIITLSGTGYTPPEQRVVLSGTTVNDPIRIEFQPAAPSVPGADV